jgi:hypothetical protein
MEDLEIASINTGTINRTGEGSIPAIISGLADLVHTTDFRRCRDAVALTATATLAISAKNAVVTITATAAATITVPPEASVAWPNGTVITLVQLNVVTYDITIAAGSGVTIRSAGSLMKITGQYSVVTLTKIGTDLWVLSGDRKA